MISLSMGLGDSAVPPHCSATCGGSGGGGDVYKGVKMDIALLNYSI